VIYPPVDVAHFAAIKRDPQDFYLFFGQLTAYKRADLAVEAFNRLGKKLVVAGSGEESYCLKKSANSNVEFLGRVSDDKLAELYSTCRALIFPGIEDFGIIPVEAQAAGVPVIAFRGGGALETVVEDETGIFFDEPTADSLMDAVERFEAASFNPATCRANTQRFSAARFRSEISVFCNVTALRGEKEPHRPFLPECRDPARPTSC